jgi:pyruvate kinase
MSLHDHKTKIVATIGPASDSPEMLERLIGAGLDIARLNLSHGDFEVHGLRIERIRAAERAAGRRITIMADLPGPKMRIGAVEAEPAVLLAGEPFVLTTDDVPGTARRVSVSFERLPSVVKAGNTLYLNDGLIQLTVLSASGHDVTCRVVVGGELRSRKGLNLPGIDLGILAFTSHDRECLAFALAHGVEAVSQSFVESAADITAVRAAARSLGQEPFVIAKIERSGALSHFDEILEAADGIMVARGDLGVELPIERIAITQKDLIRRANLAGKPVITATQMLESMTSSRLPTRAEATDVANAILDGTDCVMLSAESAVGQYPAEAVATLSRIAAATEPTRPHVSLRELQRTGRSAGASLPAETIANIVDFALETTPCAAVFVPTRSGTTARLISRHKPAEWIVAISRSAAVCAGLQFSYGVWPEHIENMPEEWHAFAAGWLRTHEQAGPLVMLVAGPSPTHPDAVSRLEFLRLE